MPLADLTDDERAVVFECLKCVAAGEIIQHDWEFPTLMGIEVDAFKQLVQKLPHIDDTSEQVNIAINNAMNNLLGYPHGHHQHWEQYMPISLDEIERVLIKWRKKAHGLKREAYERN